MHSIIGFVVVDTHNAGRELLLGYIIHLLQMEQDVVANPAARHKGRLGGINHPVQGLPQPEHHDLGHQLQITVEEGDGAVAIWVIPRLVPPLVQEHDEPRPAAQ
jgi:hypothetical protein